MNQNGCSTCKPGEERYEFFTSRINKKRYVQYDYRNEAGVLFSTIASSLAEARLKRDRNFQERKLVTDQKNISGG